MHSQNISSSNPISGLRNFHGTASAISSDIAKTSSLLSELTHLVRRRGLFMDDTKRVNSLVLTIKSNIESLNGRLDEAGNVIAAQKLSMGNNSQAGQEAMNLVSQLREEFVKATTGFKDVLQQRSDGMKEQEDRKMDVFGQASDQNMDGGGGIGGNSLALGNRPPVYESGLSLGGGGGDGIGGKKMMPMLDLTSAYKPSQGGGIPTGESTSSGSTLPRPHGGLSFETPGGPTSGLRSRTGKTSLSPYTSFDNQNNNTSTSLQTPYTPLTPLEIQQMENENGNAQMMQLIPDQNYLRDRADAMSTVESNIVELGTIFNKLAVMVSEHREMVQRVEDNVEDANQNIELSLGALTDTLTNLETNKGLFMKVFGIMVVFIILFITFFA